MPFAVNKEFRNQANAPATALTHAWLSLCLALALHVADEALTGFLSVYNPTVLALRARYWWFPMPTFQFWPWLGGLIGLVIILVSLTTYFSRGARWIRPIGYFFALINVVNALGHTIATVLGHTVSSVRFPRPAPGFYSSPLLFLAAFYVLLHLKRTKVSNET